MSEQNSYHELLRFLEDNESRAKIDAYILHALANAAEESEDIDSFSVPMLVQVENDRVDLSDLATVHGSIKNIVALSATPAQLIDLLNMPEVIKMEASLDSGIDESMIDPNFQAYSRAAIQGEFDSLSPGTFIAYVDGKLIGSAATLEELNQLNEMRIRQAPAFVHQVHMPEVTYDIPSPLSID